MFISDKSPIVEKVLDSIAQSDSSDASDNEGDDAWTAAYGFNDTGVGLPDEEPDTPDTEDETVTEAFVSKKRSTSKRKWRKVKVFKPKLATFSLASTDGMQPDFTNYKSTDYVKQCIPDEAFLLMADCSNTKCVADTGKNLNCTASELNKFFWCNILHVMYWLSENKDVLEKFTTNANHS